MSEHQLPKAYDFKNTEKRLYDWWIEKGYFRPSNDPNRPGFDAIHKAVRHFDTSR